MDSQLKRLLPTVASILVGVLPVAILILYFGVSRKLIIGWGALSYIVGVTVFKMPLYHLFVVKVLHRKLSNFWLSVAQGLVSAVSELTAALLFFIFVVPQLSLVQLIGFGAAAGALEAIMLPFIGNPLKGTPLQEHSSEAIQRASGNQVIAWMGVLERILAFLPHISCRGMVYISVITGNVIPAVVAVLTFAAIDGGAYFTHLEKWAFYQVKVLGRLYVYLTIIGFLQILFFIGFYQQLM